MEAFIFTLDVVFLILILLDLIRVESKSEASQNLGFFAFSASPEKKKGNALDA